MYHGTAPRPRQDCTHGICHWNLEVTSGTSGLYIGEASFLCYLLPSRHLFPPRHLFQSCTASQTSTSSTSFLSDIYLHSDTYRHLPSFKKHLFRHLLLSEASYLPPSKASTVRQVTCQTSTSPINIISDIPYRHLPLSSSRTSTVPKVAFSQTTTINYHLSISATSSNTSIFAQ